jgi:hypothetical protein
MKQIEWLNGTKYDIESPKRFIELRQMRHPFCEEVNNPQYMKSVRNIYVEFYGVDENAIDITSEDAFIRSFDTLGLAKIIKE